ncbi:MAG: 50S ribosomal protein L32e [Candidatus Thermoplasmatota archaeon]|nr:50S ribosomal protein L32e [Candidatus Thermoplasmatota archaeon]
MVIPQKRSELTKIKEISKEKAEIIYNNGFDTIEKLKKAKISDLEKIDGITNTMAKSIVKHLHKESEVKKTKTKKTEKPKEKQKKVEKKKTLPKEESEKEKEEIKEVEVKRKQEKIEPVTEKKVKYEVKKKPKLKKELKEKLIIRRKIKARKPKFLREEWFRYVKIPKNWRKPDGLTSKMRLHKKYRPSVVRIGFRGPRETRGLHSSGFEEVFVFNVNDLSKINPDKQAARIGSSVGTKKRLEIQKKAKELDIRILNL